VFDWDGSSWIQRGNDIDGEATEDESGYSVTMSSNANRICIGAYLNDGNGINSGHVRVFDWDGFSWIQRGDDIDGEAAGDMSGFSTSISKDGHIVAIGAYANDGNGSDAGHVRVYSIGGGCIGYKGVKL
jgi:hypothetical protein